VKFEDGGAARTVSILMAAVSVLFAIYILTPFLEEGYSPAGDDCVHISYSAALREIVTERGKLFGWSYLYGAGAPIFIFRPPGFYLASVALDLGMGGWLDLVTAHKLVYVLALALYPLAVYYLLAKFGFPRLVAGIGSLLALAPVSTWGHTLDAYFDLGLAKQALALLLFPFLLGKLHGIMRRRDSIFPGALLFGLVFLSHPYMALSATWCAGLYLVLHLVAFPFRETLRALWRSLAVFTVGILLIGFWIVPFYSSPEIHPTTAYLSQSRHGFSVMTDTAVGTVRHLLDGSLFDAPAPEPFGSGSVWAWRDNSRFGRPPALTYAALLGLAFLLAGFRSFRNLYFFCGFVFALLIFMGPDDLPVLRLIPFQEQFQYIHWIPVPELFAVSAAAVGLYSLPALAAGLVSRFARGEFPGRLAFWGGLAALLGIFLFPVWKDRLGWAGLKVRTRDFSTYEGKQTPWSLRSPVNRDFQTCLDEISRSPDFARFYASPTSLQAGQEIFFFTVAPALAGRGNVISPLFSGLKGGWNRAIGAVIRRDLWQSRRLVDLLGIHYLLTHRENLGKFDPLPGFWEEVLGEGVWRLYRARDASGSFGFTAVPAVAAFLDYRSWEELLGFWAGYYRAVPESEQAVFAVLAPGGPRPPGDPENFPWDRYCAVLVPGGDEWVSGEGAEFLAAARSAGREVFSLSALPRVRVLSGLSGVPFEKFQVPAPGWEVLGIREEAEYHEVTFRAPSPGFVYFKAAYYRGWEPLLDGVPVELVCLTPGYNALRVPAGEHIAGFSYRGANNALWGNLLSAVTLAGGLAAWARARRRRRESR